MMRTLNILILTTMRNRVQYFESNIRHTILNNTIKNIEINELNSPNKSRDKGFRALTYFFITFVTNYYKYNKWGNWDKQGKDAE